MSRYAVIGDNGVVVNVILLGSPDDWEMPDGHQVILLGDEEPCGEGYTHSADGFTPPSDDLQE